MICSGAVHEQDQSFRWKFEIQNPFAGSRRRRHNGPLNDVPFAVRHEFEWINLWNSGPCQPKAIRHPTERTALQQRGRQDDKEDDIEHQIRLRKPCNYRKRCQDDGRGSAQAHPGDEDAFAPT